MIHFVKSNSLDITFKLNKLTSFTILAELLEILSAGLLTGDTAEIVSAARAVWALAANNHRVHFLDICV